MHRIVSWRILALRVPLFWKTYLIVNSTIRSKLQWISIKIKRSLTTMHHGACLTHVPWCIPRSLNNGQWWGNHSRHSRRMQNPLFYVSGKRPIGWWLYLDCHLAHSVYWLQVHKIKAIPSPKLWPSNVRCITRNSIAYIYCLRITQESKRSTTLCEGVGCHLIAYFYILVGDYQRPPT